jgi:polyisoprenyl-phosphate glycosyltransferase
VSSTGHREMASGPEISVIIPALNEAGNLPTLISSLQAELGKLGDFEIVIVDDGSTDETREVLVEAASCDPRVHYVSLSRNFGHQAALRAGLAYSRGRCVISMDADLQHPVSLLPAMVEKWREGYEVVITLRRDPPTAPLFKRATSLIFYKVLNLFSDVELRPGSADFRLMDHKVVEVLNTMSENDLFLRGVIPWVGFKTCHLSYVTKDRLHGATKYSVRRMMSFAITGIISQSIQPLRMATVLAVIISGLVGLYSIFALLAYLFWGRTVPGWTSVVLAVCLIGSLQLLVLGVIGEYVGRILRETRKRPPFVVARASRDQTSGDEPERLVAPARAYSNAAEPQRDQADDRRQGSAS